LNNQNVYYYIAGGMPSIFDASEADAFGGPQESD